MKTEFITTNLLHVHVSVTATPSKTECITSWSIKITTKEGDIYWQARILGQSKVYAY